MDTTPRLSTRSDQVKIVTENPELLALLLEENSMEKPMRRVYIESPVIKEEDDSKYRFISTDVDSFDEGQDHALQSSPTARGRTQPRETIAVHSAPKAYDGARFEDRNMNNSSYSTGNEGLSMPTEFVIKNRDGGRLSDASDRSFGRVPPPPVQPIQTPFKPLTKEEEDDRLALEEERHYQAGLRVRLQQQRMNENDIPPLALNNLESPRPANSFQVLRDSLDDDSDATPTNEDPTQQNTNDHNVLSLVPLGERAEQDPWAERAREEERRYVEEQLRQEQMEKERLQKQLQEKDLEQMKMQQDMQRQQQQMLMQQQQQLQTMMMTNQPLMMMAAASQVNPMYAQMPNPQYSQAPQQQPHIRPPGGQPMMNLPMQQPMYYENDYVPSQENVDPSEPFYLRYHREAAALSDTESEDQELEDQEYEDHEYEDQESALVHSLKPSTTPGVDHVEINKKSLGKGKRNTTYSKMLSKRKDMKQTVPALPASRPKKPSKKEALPNRDKVPQSLPNSASGVGMAPMHRTVDKPASAENLWHQRSRSLMNQKEDKMDTQKPKKNRKPPQAKKSKEEASKASPIHHTVYTEDGQQVSVDINLKVLSPTPQAAAMTQEHAHPHPAQQPPSQAYQPHPRAQFNRPPRQAFVPPAYPQQVFASPRQRPIDPYTGTGYPQEMYQQGDYEQEPPLSSPYKILPAISSPNTDVGRQYHSDVEHPTQQISPRLEDQGSYMDAYQKTKTRNGSYKTYTLKDYKSLKNEIKLGGLGPETGNENLREKKEKLSRQQQYARKVQEKNKQQESKPGRPRLPPPGFVEEEQEDDLLHRRKIALEYAKCVPKPKVAPQTKDTLPAPQRTTRKASQRTTTTYGLSTKQQNEAEMMGLEELQQRHERERQQVALIQQNIIS